MQCGALGWLTDPSHCLPSPTFFFFLRKHKIEGGNAKQLLVSIFWWQRQMTGGGEEWIGSLMRICKGHLKDSGTRGAAVPTERRLLIWKWPVVCTLTRVSGTASETRGQEQFSNHGPNGSELGRGATKQLTTNQVRAPSVSQVTPDPRGCTWLWPGAFKSWMTWVERGPCTCCAISGMLLNLSVPQFPPL